MFTNHLTPVQLKMLLVLTFGMKAKQQPQQVHLCSAKKMSVSQPRNSSCSNFFWIHNQMSCVLFTGWHCSVWSGEKAVLTHHHWLKAPPTSMQPWTCTDSAGSWAIPGKHLQSNFWDYAHCTCIPLVIVSFQ